MAEYTTIDDFFDAPNLIRSTKRVRIPAHILAEYNQQNGTHFTELAMVVRRDVNVTDELCRSLMPSLCKMAVDAANAPHDPPVTGRKKTDLKGY